MPPQSPSDGRLRVAIVDDEPLGRERVRTLLADEIEVALVSEYANGQDAVAGMADSPPEVVFLDVQMPGLDGFGMVYLLRQVVAPADMPVVVFVTAHDDYALRAFEVSAVDYLLKPFDRTRFRDALTRARTRILERRVATTEDGASVGLLLDEVRRLRAEQDVAQAERARVDARFVVRAASRLFFVRALEVDWISGEGNYARLHTGGKTHLVRETLTSVEARLDPRQFVRIHRSAIINVERIAALQPRTHGEYLVTMTDGSCLTSSRTHGGKLRSILR